MRLVIADAYALTASFRIPENHTLQETLPLPPITTLTGILGAALGLSFPDAVRYRDEHGVKLGVKGSAEGEMSDLWKYRKVKATYKPDGSDAKDVVIRRYLVGLTLTLVFGCTAEPVARRISAALADPVYALTAGSSDDLLKVRKVRTEANVLERHETLFSNTMLPGNHQLGAFASVVIEEQPVTYSLRAPAVFLLPTEFAFEGEVRTVTQRRPFTFVGTPIALKDSIPAVRVGSDNIALM
jgi:CRISPR-associated protein Cas5t